MNGDTALDLLMGRLGNRTSADLRAKCLAEMVNVQQNMLERGPTLPWFLEATDDGLACVAATREVAVPGDFLREHEEGMLLIQDSAGVWQEMEKDDYDALISYWTYDGTTDPPLHYALVGTNFLLVPLPTAARSMVLTKYYAKDTAPSDTASTNLWLTYAPNLLIGETGMIMAGQYLQNKAAFAQFQQQATLGRQQLLTDNIAREEANTTRSMGDD